MKTSRYYQSLTEFVQKPKTTIYTGAIFSFLAVSLFGWYAIRPTLTTILFLRREIADNRLVSQQMEEKIGKLIESQAVYQSVKPRLGLLTQAIPENPAAVAVVGELKNLAETAGATVSSITVSAVPLAPDEGANPSGDKPTKPTTRRKVADTPIQMTVGGTYPTLQLLLSGILNLRRLITIDSITINPEKSTDGEAPTSDVKLKMVLKLQVHYLKE